MYIYNVYICICVYMYVYINFRRKVSNKGQEFPSFLKLSSFNVLLINFFITEKVLYTFLMFEILQIEKSVL